MEASRKETRGLQKVVSDGKGDETEVSEVPVHIPCPALPEDGLLLRGSADGLVLAISYGEGDGRVLGEEAIGLPGVGRCFDPILPEGRDVGMHLADVLKGHLEGAITLVQPASDENVRGGNISKHDIAMAR